MIREATLSPCGTYRYVLRRNGLKSQSAPPRGRLLWIMLNPSTADGAGDDPTSRKCLSFTEQLGHTDMSICNLFAYRSTSPLWMETMAKAGKNIVGPDNDAHLEIELGTAERVVLAWGVHGEKWPQREGAVRRQVAKLIDPKNVLTLGACKNGHPRHPLMMGYGPGLDALLWGTP